MCNRLKVRWESARCSLRNNREIRWTHDRQEAEFVIPAKGNYSCPTSGIPSKLFVPSYLYDFATGSFLFSLIRNLDLRIVQRDPEMLKCNINGEDKSANIRINKLGLKCSCEWELCYEINLEKVKRNTGKWQGFGGILLVWLVLSLIFLMGGSFMIERKNKVLVTSLIIYLFFFFFCVSPLVSQPMLHFGTVPDTSRRLLLIIYNPARLANVWFFSIYYTCSGKFDRLKYSLKWCLDLPECSRST